MSRNIRFKIIFTKIYNNKDLVVSMVTAVNKIRSLLKNVFNKECVEPHCSIDNRFIKCFDKKVRD